jgi:hypothetical protein
LLDPGDRLVAHIPDLDARWWPMAREFPMSPIVHPKQWGGPGWHNRRQVIADNHLCPVCLPCRGRMSRRWRRCGRGGLPDRPRGPVGIRSSRPHRRRVCPCFGQHGKDESSVRVIASSATIHGIQVLRPDVPEIDGTGPFGCPVHERRCPLACRMLCCWQQGARQS